MIADFLNKFRPGGPWLLVAMHPDKKGTPPGVTFTDAAKAEAWALEKNKTHNIYFGINPTREPINKKAEKTDIARLEWLWVDVDPRAGEDFEQERQRIRSLLNGGMPKDIPAPSLVIDSGGGYWGMWRLSEPLDIPTPASETDKPWEKAEAFNVELANRLGGDHCFNVDRIARLPGLTNWPDPKKRAKGREPSKAEVCGWNDAAYPLTAFKAAPRKAETITGGTPTASRKASPRCSVGDGTASPSDWVPGHVAPCSTDDLREWAAANGKTIRDNTLALIATGQDPVEPTKYPSRSEPLFKVCLDLVRAGVDDAVIFRVITDPGNAIAESVREQPSWEGYAKRQIFRAWEEIGRKWWRHPKIALEYLNNMHAVLSQEGGKCRVLAWSWVPLMTDDDDDKPREEQRGRWVPLLQSFEDFQHRYCHLRVEAGTDKDGKPIEVPVGKWWLLQEARRQFDELCFHPKKPETVGRNLNLWRGWGVKPQPGDWSLMRAHVEAVLADGNADHADYILKWAAWAVQNPHKPAEAALVFRGGKGAGKGMFARALKDLFGQHGLHIFSGDYLTGKFNAHLRDAVLVFADEAVAPDDNERSGRLQGLITEPTFVVEGKGANAVQVNNMLHVVMASNEKWVVPASSDERRYAVFNVNGNRAQDRDYFGPLAEQMANGGLAAMLHDLLEMDLDGFHPRWNIPQTDALTEQKLAGLRGVERAFLDILQTGELPVERWLDKKARTLPFVSTTRLCELVNARLRKDRGRDVTPNEVADLLKALGFEYRQYPVRGFALPTLADARAAWDRVKIPAPWDGSDRWTDLPPPKKPDADGDDGSPF